MIYVWNEILSEGTHGAKNHRIVYEGETVILDCYLTAVGVILHYPVFWVKEGKKIATKNQNRLPYINNEYSHLPYSVRYTSSQAQGRPLSWFFHHINDNPSW